MVFRTRFDHFSATVPFSALGLITTATGVYTGFEMTKGLLYTDSLIDKIGYLSGSALGASITIVGFCFLRNITKFYMATKTAADFYNKMQRPTYLQPRQAEVARNALYCVSAGSISIFAISKLISSYSSKDL